MRVNLEQEYKAGILVVENEVDNLCTLSNLLVERGYQIRQAIDGEMAIMAAQTIPPDLILLDVKLPRLNGYELCQQLKTIETTKEIPVIFLSELDDSFDKARAFAVGGADYIAKPYQPEEVIIRVETQLKLSALQKQLAQKDVQLEEQLCLNEIVHRFHPQPQLNLLLLDRAIAATPNGIVITNATAPDNPVIYVNPGFERMTGYSSAES